MTSGHQKIRKSMLFLDTKKWRGIYYPCHIGSVVKIVQTYTNQLRFGRVTSSEVICYLLIDYRVLFVV